MILKGLPVEMQEAENGAEKNVRKWLDRLAI